MAINRNIHREVVKASIAESKLPAARATLEKNLKFSMRDAGYALCLDLDTIWVCNYDPEQNNYVCELTMYFIYVGRKKAWEIEGISSGRTIPMSTPQAK